jgi:hypothetical protein
MRKYLGAEVLAHDSPALRFRDRNSSVGRLDTFMAAHTSVPSDFPRYVALSQWVQAETLRTRIETSRRRMWECSGVLFWQWNDCWPGITWSVVDFDGRLKAAYFVAKRAWHPRILAIVDEAPAISLTKKKPRCLKVRRSEPVREVSLEAPLDCWPVLEQVYSSCGSPEGLATSGERGYLHLEC